MRMAERVHTTDAVFAVNRDLPLNYISRDEVDGKFIDILSRKQHIVIYGSSKQGKTSLRKHCLNDDDYVVVSCQNKWTLGELHASVLKEAGFTVKQSTERSVSGKHKMLAEIGARLKLHFLADVSAKTAYEHEHESGTKETFVPLELDVDDPNDIVRALNEVSFRKFIVLEDFHYLPDETQKDFSFSLKTFHENSKLSFIVVGVWREENRLIGFNGDLTDRVLSVDVDTWTPDTLRCVMDEGGALLNIKFDETFTSDLLARCFDSVHIVQEACRRACGMANVSHTQDDLRVVGQGVDVSILVGAVVAEQAGRYNGFLERFADGFQETDYEMPKWIVYAILCCSVNQLEKGVRLRRISKLIKAQHPKGTALNAGNITQILNSTTALQNKKSIRSLVVDYDTANTSLHIVDKGFLIWLDSQNRSELLEDLGLPELIEPETEVAAE